MGKQYPDLHDPGRLVGERDEKNYAKSLFQF